MTMTQWAIALPERKQEFLDEIDLYKYPHYEDLLRAALKVTLTDDFDEPDLHRIHEINDGDYQGTLVFVVGARGYQPYKYWITKVSYGSCSGCDALQDALGYSEESRNDEALYSLALHMMQQLKEV